MQPTDLETSLTAMFRSVERQVAAGDRPAPGLTPGAGRWRPRLRLPVIAATAITTIVVVYGGVAAAAGSWPFDGPQLQRVSTALAPALPSPARPDASKLPGTQSYLRAPGPASTTLIVSSTPSDPKTRTVNGYCVNLTLDAPNTTAGRTISNVCSATTGAGTVPAPTLPRSFAGTGAVTPWTSPGGAEYTFVFGDASPTLSHASIGGAAEKRGAGSAVAPGGWYVAWVAGDDPAALNQLQLTDAAGRPIPTT